MQFQPEPGEQAPADIALEVQFEVGLVPGELADLVLVVVRVEEVGQHEAGGDDEQQQDQGDDADDFAERFHGRVLVQAANGMARKYTNDAPAPQPAGQGAVIAELERGRDARFPS